MSIFIDWEHGSDDEHKARPEAPFKTIQAALGYLDMKKVGGLFIRGTGFSAEQIAGYNRDRKRLVDWASGKRPTAEETAASIARAEASERAFQEWDKKRIKRR